MTMIYSLPETIPSSTTTSSTSTTINPSNVNTTTNNRMMNQSSALARKRRRLLMRSQRSSSSSSSTTVTSSSLTSSSLSLPLSGLNGICPTNHPAPLTTTPTPLTTTTSHLSSTVTPLVTVSMPAYRQVSSESTTLPVRTSIADPILPPVAASSSSSSTDHVPKKAQKRYDPDIPMTKEETAAWRREQRRKRNRESAAASRQRQRDRILELESEVEEWKDKFTEVMTRLQSLENILAQPSSQRTQDPLSMLRNAAFTVSPPSSQSSSPK